eukprot:3637921-Prymnesium_polylepis.1
MYFLKKPSDFGQGFRPNGSDRDRKVVWQKYATRPEECIRGIKKMRVGYRHRPRAPPSAIGQAPQSSVSLDTAPGRHHRLSAMHCKTKLTN